MARRFAVGTRTANRGRDDEHLLGPFEGVPEGGRIAEVAGTDTDARSAALGPSRCRAHSRRWCRPPPAGGRTTTADPRRPVAPVTWYGTPRRSNGSFLVRRFEPAIALNLLPVCFVPARSELAVRPTHRRHRRGSRPICSARAGCRRHDSRRRRGFRRAGSDRLPDSATAGLLDAVAEHVRRPMPPPSAAGRGGGRRSGRGSPAAWRVIIGFGSPTARICSRCSPRRERPPFPRDSCRRTRCLPPGWRDWPTPGCWSLQARAVSIIHASATGVVLALLGQSEPGGDAGLAEAQLRRRPRRSASAPAPPATDLAALTVTFESAGAEAAGPQPG